MCVCLSTVLDLAYFTRMNLVRMIMCVRVCVATQCIRDGFRIEMHLAPISVSLDAIRRPSVRSFDAGICSVRDGRQAARERERDRETASKQRIYV